ncbi:WD40 repeat domain-containing protein [Capilliphycus salinus ALCB114379]|uniref:WD40 repeat domain-containing protein n=1 Tax=Capilliphycus salinus TaxID=2768948 RepID=UPI0039A6DBFD
MTFCLNPYCPHPQNPDNNRYYQSTAEILADLRSPAKFNEVYTSLNPWENTNGVRTLTGHLDSVKSVSFSPDNRTLASGSFDKTIRLWNLETQTEMARLQGHFGWIMAIAFKPNNCILASGSFDRTIKLWNLKTHREITTLGRHSGLILSVAFSPDGHLLASGSFDNTIKLWNLETRTKIITLRGH